MNDSNDVLQLLGRIDGKLDQVIEQAKEHRADDSRRFAAIDERIDEHERDINQAKGAKGAIVWLAGVVAALAGTAVTVVGKKLGLL